MQYYTHLVEANKNEISKPFVFFSSVEPTRLAVPCWKTLVQLEHNLKFENSNVKTICSCCNFYKVYVSEDLSKSKLVFSYLVIFRYHQ